MELTQINTLMKMKKQYTTPRVQVIKMTCRDDFFVDVINSLGVDTQLVKGEYNSQSDNGWDESTITVNPNPNLWNDEW